MNRRLGAVAIVLMALTAFAGVLSYVFLSKKDPQISVAQNQVVEAPSSPSPSPQPSAPFPSGAPEGQSSAANLPNQPQGTSTSAQKSSTNRVAQKAVPAASAPRRSIADILEGVDLSKPGERERVVAEMKALEEVNKNAAIARARELGLPIRREMPDGRVQEVAGLDENGQLLYRTTYNVNAAISTGVKLIQPAPYSLTGTNVLVGVWDVGAVRPTHQEFGGRVTVRDGAANDNHATHVGGTIIASGINTNAKGMATSARIDSYDWNSDLTELTAAGAANAGQTNKVLISNHSYGYVSGWNYVGGGTPYRVWEWNGNGTTATGTEQDFGRYEATARDTDATVVAVPFTTVFWAAGNDRNNNPSASQAVALSPGGSTVVSYNSGSHPPGDGVYRGGYENIGFNGLAKNIITIGAVSNAVTTGSRDITKGTQSSFSSWGPTDDGRIKPDLVANGVGVYSSLATGDTNYGTYDGTSMASPNAAGSAALVVQEYLRLFGVAPRASTVKGLLIQTADDLGTVGPDYQNGWGLINAKAAVDLIRDDAASPAKQRLVESLLTNGTSITNTFFWDGNSPIRATVCWTDPAGIATTINNNRTNRLVNNLDLRIVGPNGQTHRPYIMPFVETWTTNSMGQSAVTGTNNTDNVEQVYIASPSAKGTYQAIVSHQGTLSGSPQAYSLLISGSSTEPLSSLAPLKGYAGSRVLLKITGSPTWRDSAESYSSWTNNSGSTPRFGSWSLSNSPAAGFFVGTSINSNMNVATPKGFGLYAASNAAATAIRDFSVPMVVGDRFTLKFDNNRLQTGGQAGFSLADSNGATRFRFYFVGGESHYRVSDATTNKQTSIPYTDGGLSLTFTLTSTNGYLLDAGNGYSLAGPLAAGSAISRLSLEAKDLGNGGSYDFFVGEMALSGPPLSNTSQIHLIRDGEPTVASTTAQFSNGELLAELNLQEVASGAWDVLAVNTDGSSVRFPGAFTVEDALWSENFDTTVTGWSNSIITGSGSWSLSTNRFDSPSRSYAAAAPATKMTVALVSPTISVPTNAANLQLKFNHWYAFQGGQDGGRLEISTNNGTDWFATDDPNSGVAFATNGYNTNMATGGNPNSLSAFSGKPAWSGTNGIFTQTILNLTNSAKFAGNQVRFRWVLASDSTISSTGWHLDSIAFLGTLNVPASTPATITLGNLAQAYDGNPKQVSTTTDPPGLSVAVTYNDLSTSPTDVGTYAVTAIITSSGYSGSTSGNLTITKGSQTILFGALPPVSFGDPSFEAGATASSGLPITYASSIPSVATVDPDGTVHVLGAGTTIITASQPGDDNYFPATSMEQSLTVDKAPASVILSDLSQTYDGSARPVTATTTPPGLSTSITYDGSATAPVNAGSYAVVATVNEPNYEGSATDTLTVAQATQAITFSTPSTARVGEIRGLSASTASGLPVTFASSDNSIASVAGSEVTFQAPGDVTLTASQAGNDNYLAASNVAVMVSVSGVQNPTGDTNGDGIPNLLEYALATNSNGSILPVLDPPTDGTLTLTAIVRTNDPGLTNVVAQGVTNLLDYTNSNSISTIPGIASTNPAPVPPGFQRRAYEFNAGTNASRAFLKLTIQQQ